MVGKHYSAILVLVLAAMPVLAADYGQSRAFAERDLPRLERHYQEQINVNPFDPVALNNLAVAKAEQGDVYTALDLLERATRLAPANEQIKRNLVRVEQWQQVQSSDFVPPARYELPPGFGEQGLPPAPPNLWEPSPRIR